MKLILFFLRKIRPKNFIDYPDVQGFPVVFIDGEYIRGLVPLAKKFLADGLVTTSKK
jgi:hypothetical protein